MAPPRPWHSDLDTQVPVSPVEATHSLLGKVTIWNKLNTDRDVNGSSLYLLLFPWLDKSLVPKKCV